MKAAVLYGPGELRVEQRPMPGAPGSGEVLLRLRSIGICGSDVHAFADFAMGGEPFPAPQTICHECAAEVVEVGPGVERLVPGHRVGVEPSRSCGRCEWCRGGAPNICPDVQFLGFPGTEGVSQEFAVISAEQCYAIPEGIGFDEAVVLEPLQIRLLAAR
ncbi:MAG: alcohol dehydrogenase catalytic domain-containing protein, partial [Planctomycetia bacterium]|nr:alcohol dehydrogenase catalytic domain-containing protein [Planctomycetia bacterium]